MRMTYDYVLSLGQWCATAIYLKKLGFRKFSSPFDWTGPDQAIQSYINLMINGFAGFMEKANMRFLSEAPNEGTVHYIDDATGFQSHHEFKIGVPFDEMFASFRETLNRRIARFLDVLRDRNSILFVHYHGEGHYDRTDVVAAVNRLRLRFPRARMDVIVLETEKHSNEIVREEPADGVVFYSADFYDRARYDAVLGNEVLCKQVLDSIRMHGRVANLVRLRLRRLKANVFRAFNRRGCK